MQPYEEYGKRIKAASTVGPLNSELFGDSISLYNGSAEFSAVDIDLPGNNALPVQLRRRLKITEFKGANHLGGFGEWDLDVPHLHGVFDKIRGWQSNINGQPDPFRCSNASAPAHSAVGFSIDEIWHGTFMHIPGQGDREMLKNDQIKVPSVTDGRIYPWITSDFYRIRCLPSIANSNTHGGEAFVALSPEGWTYTFDHLIDKHTTGLYKQGSISPGNGVDLERRAYWMLATKIEDQFGNWVKFNYDAQDRLASITSNDGRAITLTYSGDGKHNILRATVGGTPERSWIYTYVPAGLSVYPMGWPQQFGRNTLESVQLPDGSAWQFSHINDLTSEDPEPTPGRVGDLASGHVPCEPRMPRQGFYTLNITHPSGAFGVFEFEMWRHFRAVDIKLESNCWLESTIGQDYETMRVPNYFEVWTITGKSINGPGIVPANWQYDFGSVVPVGSCESACQLDKTVTVTQPDGSLQEHDFGVYYGKNEGRLLAQRTLEADRTIREATTNTYISDTAVQSELFADVYGNSLIPGFDPVSNRIRPVIARATNRDAVTYATANSNFDSFARAQRIVKSSNPGFSRVEVTGFHDNRNKWILGQVQSVAIGSTVASTVATSNTYDAGTAQLLTRSTFSVLESTLTYNNALGPQAGTISTITDGASQTTSLSNWKRGVPLSVLQPDGRTQAAEVNDSGWLTSITDQLLSKTNYAHDAMGRLMAINYPSPDTVAWQPTTINFAPNLAEEFGLPDGHWKQVSATGAGTTTTYFDAYWRPIIAVTEVAGDVSSRSFVVKRYDQLGREVFSSYPVRELSSFGDILAGVSTTYDALSRVVRVEQDAEPGADTVQGKLISTTDYLPGGRVRTTDPRGNQTTTSFQAFDAPSYDAPVLIQAPEGVTTAISRDVFGKPLEITRSGSGG